MVTQRVRQQTKDYNQKIAASLAACVDEFFVGDFKSGAAWMSAAVEAKSSRYETAMLEAQERERRMALLLISPQDSKEIINQDFYFFL